MLTLTFVLMFSQAHADPGPEPVGITLEDAVRQADRSPSVQAAGSAREAARAGYAAAWPGRLPSVAAQGNVVVYNEAQSIDPFGTGQPIVMRDQVTSSFTAQVSVPVTGQIATDRQVAAARYGMDAARASEVAAIADAEFEANDAWFTAAQMEGQLGIATEQAKGLAERARVAEVAFTSGSLTRNDLLLVRIALAQANQAVIQLQGLRDLAWARLGSATGSEGVPVRPIGANEDPPRAPPPTGALVDHAFGSRPELLALRATAASARANAAAASWARLPAISGMGVYQHQTGQGLFGTPDTAYLGATLNWNVWSWGRAAAGVTAAAAQADQLDAQVRVLQSGIRMDVLARVQALSTAASTWALAADTIVQATENLTIQERRQQAGTGTMQEVLDANLALVRAQSTRTSALFDARRAEAALAHAVGADPWGLGASP